ncbi:zinc finger protein 501-like [Cydia pomonella]|uniref:zinc finger protein 501-like n=1 Tax=Cydia pomonella TaxID=82600 RepID=UPI002ADD8993|nr:zinc finger protein 501-like [Cydia pomonella]
MNACYCCLRRAPDKDLTTPYTYLGKTEIYADMLTQCFDIHLILGGSASCGICLACVGRLRDASDFKLQVQRSQAELRARLQGASLVKEEEPAVKSEMQDGDGTSDTREEPPVKLETLDKDGASDEMDDMIGLNVASGVGASTEDDPLLLEERAVKVEVSAAARDEERVSVCLDDSTASAPKELAIACTVVLEPLRGNLYGCAHCGKRFRNKSNLRKHIQKTHLKTAPKQFTCDFCSSTCSTFKTESLVLKHENSEHDVTNFMCAECETTIYKKSLETANKSSQRSNLLKHFTCSHCDYKTHLKQNLKSHIRIHTGEKPYKCNLCDYKCWANAILRRHERTHTGEKPFPCNYCDKKLSSKAHLVTHEMIHTKAKPFKCCECDFKCRQKASLARHQMIHTGEKPYTCSHCEYRCSDSSRLRRHEIKHTGEKPFQCSHCGFKCSRKSDLNKHLKIHTGEKPFKCSNCDYKSTRKETLLKHQRTHIETKPFICSHCNYTTRHKQDLQRHLRKKHSGEKS